ADPSASAPPREDSCHATNIHLPLRFSSTPVSRNGSRSGSRLSSTWRMYSSSIANHAIVPFDQTCSSMIGISSYLTEANSCAISAAKASHPTYLRPPIVYPMTSASCAMYRDIISRSLFALAVTNVRTTDSGVTDSAADDGRAAQETHKPNAHAKINRTGPGSYERDATGRENTYVLVSKRLPRVPRVCQSAVMTTTVTLSSPPRALAAAINSRHASAPSRPAEPKTVAMARSSSIFVRPSLQSSSRSPWPHWCRAMSG